MEKVLASRGWEILNFNDAINKISTTNKKVKQKEYIEKAEIPVIDQGQEFIGGYTADKTKVLECELPAIVFGDHTKVIKLINFKFAPGADGVKVIVPKKIFLPKTFYFFLQILKNKLPDKGYARHFQHLEKLMLPLAPLPEQRAIVAKIERLFSELDDGIASLKKAQEQLKIYRQAVLKKAFEGELTKKWRESQTNLPSADDLLQEIKKERETALKTNGNKRKPIKPLTKEELAKLPNLPASWAWIKSAEIIDPINNGYTPKANFLSSGSGEIPFIKVYNLNFDGTFNFAKEPTFIPLSIHKKELARSITYPGDILINIVGPPLGKVSIVTNQFPEWNINQAIVLFRPNELMCSKYISYFLQNPITVRWFKATSKATAGQFNVKVSTCREIPFPFCSQKEQSQLIQEIETRLSVCDNIEANSKEALFKAKALRQSILKKAFEGKLLDDQELQETRQAPDWEPADQLLERIKQK